MSVDYPPRRKMSLKLKLLLGIGIPLVLILVVALTFDHAARGKLDAALNEARTIGGPITIEELMAARKTWPDHRNGADVILKLKDRFTELTKGDALQALPMFSNRALFPDQAGARPALGRRPSEAEDRAAGETLDLLAPELARIDSLLGYEGGRFPLAVAPNPIQTLLPDLAHLRTSARLKASQCEYRAAHGDAAHLEDDLAVLFAHGRLLADEPTLISALVAVACDSLAVGTLQRVCALTPLTPRQLTGIQERLASMKRESRLEWGIRGERALFLGMAELTWGQGDLSPLSGNPGGSSPVPGWTGRVPGFRGLLKRDSAAGLRFLNRMVSVAGDRRQALETARESAAEREKLPVYFLLTKLMSPSWERVIEIDCNLEARIRSAEAAMAAERFRIDRGRFPETLEALVPQYLTAVPLDPFDDEPLRIRHENGALKIYSKGLDGIDNGGAIEDWLLQGPYPDCGFILLPPDSRGLPSSQPAREASPTPRDEAAEGLEPAESQPS